MGGRAGEASPPRGARPHKGWIVAAFVLLQWSTRAIAGDVFAPAWDGSTLDAAASVATPGDVKIPLHVLGVGSGKGAWQTAALTQPGEAAFTIKLKAAAPIGTVVVAEPWSLRMLTSGAPWREVGYPGPDENRLRYIPLPPDARPEALQLVGPMDVRDDGRFGASLSSVRTLRGRMINVAPLAEVHCSSSDEPAKGFRPDPRLNRPAALVDGTIGRKTWTTAKRDTPITMERPEWIVLDWISPRSVRACSLFVSDGEAGFGRILVQRFTGQGKADGADADPWETIATATAPGDWDFGRDVTASALRFFAVEGGARSPNAIGLTQIAVLEDLHDRPVPATLDDASSRVVGAVPLQFTLPAAGKATIQILDEKGHVVQNLVNGHDFDAGENTVHWDLSTIEDWSPYSKPAGADPRPRGPLALPGTYRWRGLYNPGLSLEYLYSFNPLKQHGVAWITADRKGGWLSDHTPPRDVVRMGDRMWIGTFAEGGHALLEADRDMKKLWGSERIWLACPRIMAPGSDGEHLYYIDQGGWVGKRMVLIQVNTRTKASRRIMAAPIEDNKEYTSRTAAYLSDRAGEVDLQGLAVVGDRGFIANRAKDVVWVVDLSRALAAKPRGFSWDAVGKTFDDEKMVIVREIVLPRPGRIRPYDDRHVAAVSDKQVVLIDIQTGTVTPLIRGLVNPLGLAVDAQRNVYVAEREPLHQVKVFSPQGKLIRIIGKGGRHEVGPFDSQRMENPAGIDVDAAGNLWVCEFSGEVKRTSIWDRGGNCINQVIGPPEYGGGGDIDPRNPNRHFYRGQEIVRNPATGQVQLTRVLWRSDDKTYPTWGGHPAYPFYRNDKLFFTTWSGPFGKVHTLTLWVLDSQSGGRLRPVAAMGRNADDKQNPVFAWTDLNDNGKVDDGETRAGPIMLGGKPHDNLGTAWQWRMNQDFEAATSDGGYDAVPGGGGIAFFHVERLTPQGYPVYRLPTAFHPAPGRHAADAVFTDRQGNAISLESPIFSMKPDGTINWTFRNAWAGLHAGHSTTARGDEPGVTIATTRFFGSVAANDSIGEVLFISGNLGVNYLITADGLYVDQVWKDVRRGVLLRQAQPPSVELANQLTLHDEHFGGTIQRVMEADGRSHVRYVVSPCSPHSAVYELHGLDQLQRLAGGTFTVTPQQYVRQQRIREERLYAATQPKRYTIARMASVAVDADSGEWGKDRINGFALGYDASNLYVLYEGKDDRAPFQNAATDDDFVEAFTKGDVLDVMLQTLADLKPDRKDAGEGDIRLSFTTIGGKPAAILYDFVVPGTPEHARLPFASPWRTVFVDRVTRLGEAKIAVQRKGGGVTLEASVPLVSLKLDPRALPVTRGDVGVVASDESGSAAVDRTYWSNPNTKIVSDVPEEARLQPALWGTFEFGASEP